MYPCCWVPQIVLQRLARFCGPIARGNVIVRGDSLQHYRLARDIELLVLLLTRGGVMGFYCQSVLCENR
ncbi:hypothetical protein [Candidatus Vallotia lariciata]|uniref:hypothetical protein n=1 Tax=Candidatus Vallotia laricis TaxID=2018052 RepID=UPI001D001B63|nr:hypothetical protein [Candidatus Vallotia lariciata]